MSSALLIKLHRKHDLTWMWICRVYRVTYRRERTVPSCNNYTSPNPIVALGLECHTFVGGVQKFAFVSRSAKGAVLSGIVRETGGSHYSVSDADRLLGSGSVSFGEQLPTFRRIVVLSPSESSSPSIYSLTRPCMKAVRCPVMSETTRPVTQRHIPGNSNLKLFKGS